MTENIRGTRVYELICGIRACTVLVKQLWFSFVYWDLTPQQEPGSYQGGEMMMKSGFWWRNRRGSRGGGVVPPPALDHQFIFSTNFLTIAKKKSLTPPPPPAKNPGSAPEETGVPGGNHRPTAIVKQPQVFGWSPIPLDLTPIPCWPLHFANCSGAPGSYHRHT